jgi:CMP-N-acetylneuraminic acid synthetase
MQAFLPLKAHSERVPGKNFRLLGDKPLYMWIVETLLDVPLISGLIIDTDSEDSDLWKLSKHSKIEVKMRAPNLVGDFVSMNEIIWDHVSTTTEKDFIMTHATNPFLSKATIVEAIEKYYEMKQKEFDSLFSVSQIQGRIFNASGFPLNHDPSNLIRTQDLDAIFLENSCLYIFDKATFTNHHARIGTKPFLMPIPVIDSIDIDTKDEWDLAQQIAAGRGTSISN